MKEGDRVKKDELLVRILPDIYQSYVDRSVAAVNSSKAILENAKSRLMNEPPHFQLSSSGLTGRSGIPENSVMEPKSRDVLDPPAFAEDDGTF